MAATQKLDDAVQGTQRRAALLAHLPALARNVRSTVLAETGGGSVSSVV